MCARPPRPQGRAAAGVHWRRRDAKARRWQPQHQVQGNDGRRRRVERTRSAKAIAKTTVGYRGLVRIQGGTCHACTPVGTVGRLSSPHAHVTAHAHMAHAHCDTHARTRKEKALLVKRYELLRLYSMLKLADLSTRLCVCVMCRCGRVCVCVCVCVCACARASRVQLYSTVSLLSIYAVRELAHRCVRTHALQHNRHARLTLDIDAHLARPFPLRALVPLLTAIPYIQTEMSTCMHA